MVVEEEVRKGPWTEEEDYKLVYFVGLFGDRRWDFIAKVSGLSRTGKSCRLRWVNYLHPGLKRGKLTPQEEHLVMELHSKWGNRWSRIARKLPGRTDNEIKNFWRTHLRKQKAQQKKHATASSPASSSTCESSLSSSNNNHAVDSSKETGEESFYDTGGPIFNFGGEQQQGAEKGYSMDDIWKNIEEENMNLQPLYEEACNFSCPYSIPSLFWENSSEPLWVMDEEGSNKMLFPSSDDHYFCSYELGSGFLTTG